MARIYHKNHKAAWIRAITSNLNYLQVIVDDYPKNLKLEQLRCIKRLTDQVLDVAQRKKDPEAWEVAQVVIRRVGG